jgi:hypothetical protein
MRRVACLAVLLLCAGVAAGEVRTREFPVGNSVVLHIGLDDSWKEVAPDPGSGASISIVSKTPDRFNLLLTPVPVAEGQSKPEGEIRALVQAAADGLAPQSVEKKLKIESLRGPHAAGYYFHATDPAPKKGEYRFLYQGAVSSGPAIVSFTVLYNRGGEEEAKKALAAVQAMRAEARRGNRS